MDEAQKSLQEMSVIVDLEYTNGFSISIDADLILGRSAYIHIKVVSIKGKARIQFSRSPFTHWNFAFIEDPQIEFDANSHFDGRQIPQLTALILNQVDHLNLLFKSRDQFIIYFRTLPQKIKHF